MNWDLGPVRRRGQGVRVAISVAAVLLFALCWWLLRAGSATGPVTLASPSAYQGAAGFAVGFPHSELGAASAAAATLEAAWTIDTEQAMAAAQLYSLPEQQAQAREGGRSVADDWRRAIGLPVVGELPPGAAMKATPIGIRWQARSEDRVLVSVLIQVTAAKGDADSLYSSSYAMNVLMTWHPNLRGGDWVNIPDPQPTAAPPVAAPGTPQFAAAGWRPIALTHRAP